MRRGGGPRALAVEGLLLELAAALAGDEPPAAGTPPGWLKRAAEALESSAPERVPLGILAGWAGVHPVTLARQFRRYFGCTVGERVSRLRIEAACRLLAGTGTPLARVAADTGFASQAHFSTRFKRHTGLTPSAYRAGFRAG